MFDESPAELSAGAIGLYSDDIVQVSSHAYMWAVFEGLILYGQGGGVITAMDMII